MFKNKLKNAVIAAKNVFVRGNGYARLRRILLMFAIPLMNHDLELFWSNDVFSWVVYDLEYSSEMGELAIGLVGGLIVFALFWFWQLFLGTEIENSKEIKMKAEQKIFVYISSFLFVCLFIFVRGYFDLQNSGFGGVFQTLCGIASFGVAVMGVVLIIDAAKKMENVPIYYELMTTTTCVAATFFFMTESFWKMVFGGGRHWGWG